MDPPAHPIPSEEPTAHQPSAAPSNPSQHAADPPSQSPPPSSSSLDPGGTTLTLPHLPSQPVHISLFTRVRNAPVLVAQLRARNALYDYAFADAALLLSTRQVLAAVFRALHDAARGRALVRAPHAAVVAALSPGKNIADALRRFGVREESRAVVVVKVLGSLEEGREVEGRLAEIVDGQRVRFEDEVFRQGVDWERLRKAYKIERPAWLGRGASTDEVGEDEWREMEAVVLGIIALKGS